MTWVEKNNHNRNDKLARNHYIIKKYSMEPLESVSFRNRVEMFQQFGFREHRKISIIWVELDDLRVDVCPPLGVVSRSGGRINVAQPDTGDVDSRPDGNAGVAVLADDPTVRRRRCHVEAARQQEAKARRVQIGARAQNPLLGKAAQLPRHVRQQIHCIRK